MDNRAPKLSAHILPHARYWLAITCAASLIATILPAMLADMAATVTAARPEQHELSRVEMVLAAQATIWAPMPEEQLVAQGEPQPHGDANSAALQLASRMDASETPDRPALAGTGRRIAAKLETISALTTLAAVALAPAAPSPHARPATATHANAKPHNVNVVRLARHTPSAAEAAQSTRAARKAAASTPPVKVMRPAKRTIASNVTPAQIIDLQLQSLI